MTGHWIAGTNDRSLGHWIAGTNLLDWRVEGAGWILEGLKSARYCTVHLTPPLNCERKYTK